MPKHTSYSALELRPILAQLSIPEVVAFYIFYLNITRCLRNSPALAAANPTIQGHILSHHINIFIQNNFHVSAHIITHLSDVICFASDSVHVEVTELLKRRYHDLTGESVLPWFTSPDFAQTLLTHSHAANPAALPFDLLQETLVHKGIHNITDILRQIELLHATGEIVRRDERIQISVEANGWYKVICFANKRGDEHIRADTRTGSSKTIRLNVVVLWICPFPGMQFFTSAQGFQTCYFGMPYASLSRHSPVLRDVLGDTVEHERQSARLRGEGFIPFVKHSKTHRGRTQQTFLIPHLGDNVEVLVNRGFIFDQRLMEKLLARVLELAIANHFALHDVKPANILYDTRTDTFELIDWQHDGFTIAFIHFAAHLDDEAPDDLNYLADTLIHTMLFLFNDNTELTRTILMDFLHRQLASNPAFNMHPYAREFVRVCDHISHYAVLHPEYIHPSVRRRRSVVAVAEPIGRIGRESCGDSFGGSFGRGFGDVVHDDASIVFGSSKSSHP